MSDSIDDIRAERASLHEVLESVAQLTAEQWQAQQSGLYEMAKAVQAGDAAKFRQLADAQELGAGLVETLGESHSGVQRRLEYLTTEELTRESINVAKAAKRAAWATFWVALFAMIVTTAATLTTAVMAS